MPYKNPERQRAYLREYQRGRRAGLQTPGKTRLPSTFRLEQARGILSLLLEQIEAVRTDKEAGTLEKARCVGYLAAIALKAIETADLENRIEALEEKLEAEGGVACLA